MSVLSVLARRAHVPCATPALQLRLPLHSAVMSWSCCLSYRDSTRTEERGKERGEGRKRKGGGPLRFAGCTFKSLQEE